LAEVDKSADRVVLIEDTPELQWKTPNLVALCAKDGVASPGWLQCPGHAWVTKRSMECGSQSMLADFRQIMENCGFRDNNSGRPGQFVIERALVHK
jgi:hypothetical protein